MKKVKQRWVVKVGSNIVCSGGPLLLRAWMQQIRKIREKHGIEVIWVTSGAIASAVDRTGFKNTKGKLSEKQALSAIGQPLLMDLYNISLQSVGLMGAQILLTADDMAHPERRRNLENTLKTLLQWGTIPILNENDAVATDEIKFGDNDSLSAKVAKMVRAHRLILLTDVEGLFDLNPNKHKEAKLISSLREITPALLRQLGQSAGSSRGTGGMYSKVSAAREATKHGIETWLVRGDLPNALVKIATNEPVGTRVMVKK